MILSLVSELLSRVAHRPEIEETLEALRRSAGEVRLAGLTDPAKAFAAAVATFQLGRPTILIVESNQRAEMLLEPVRWFYRAITGKPDRRVALLPAYDVLPYELRSPHAEISEDRAVALWRFALGEADLLIVPIQAAVWRLREPEFYGELALTIARDQSIAHETLLTFLRSAGYDKQTTCEMPGQYAVRGGIIDIFSPESPQPVRVELLGDTIESIRALDPNTQRSTNPVERSTLMPLTEFPRHSEVLDRLRVRTASNREDDSAPEGFYPGWEFREVLHEERKSTILDLGPDPLVIEDEPSLLADCLEKYRKQLQESFDESDDPLAEPLSAYLFNDEELQHAVGRLPRLAVEHLDVAREGSTSVRTLHTQPTTHYHGDVAAFVAEVRPHLHRGARSCFGRQHGRT